MCPFFCFSSTLAPLPLLLFPLLILPVGLLCLSGYYDLGGFSCSQFIVSIRGGVGCECECARARVSPPSALSRVLVPASWQRGATQQPGCDWAGGVGFLTQAWCCLLWDVFQQMVEVRECHHIGARIRGERLSSRSCVVPLPTRLYT